MTKLNDLQRIFLANAAQQPAGTLLPVPGSLSAPQARIDAALRALLKRGLAAEAPAQDAASTWRENGDAQFTLVITEAGHVAIGTSATSERVGAPPEDAAVNLMPADQPKPSKQATVLGLLKRTDGATLPELVAATGWLPHTTRAALTGLRQKGHAIERGKREDATCYRIAV